MITIVDYGLGNIQAFINVYNRLNIPVVIADNVEKLKLASKLILPGVGAFDHAMRMLNHSGMRETIENLVMSEKKPILGICVGMQMLAQASDEGKLPGLSWIEGCVKKLNNEFEDDNLQLPHMGWNTLKSIRENPLLRNISDNSRFYFLHSYYFHCKNQKDVIASTEYGRSFTSALNCGRIYGVQFHPEKSHHNGIQLLKNFAEL